MSPLSLPPASVDTQRLKYKELSSLRHLKSVGPAINDLLRQRQSSQEVKKKPG